MWRLACAPLVCRALPLPYDVAAYSSGVRKSRSVSRRTAAALLRSCSSLRGSSSLFVWKVGEAPRRSESQHLLRFDLRSNVWFKSAID